MLEEFLVSQLVDLSSVILATDVVIRASQIQACLVSRTKFKLWCNKWHNLMLIGPIITGGFIVEICTYVNEHYGKWKTAEIPISL